MARRNVRPAGIAVPLQRIADVGADRRLRELGGRKRGRRGVAGNDETRNVRDIDSHILAEIQIVFLTCLKPD